MKNIVFLHGKTITNNTSTCNWTEEVELIDKPMAHHRMGLQFTATGYGPRIPTVYMVRFNGKLRRVYCRIFSNIGTCYIGKFRTDGEVIIVQM